MGGALVTWKKEIRKALTGIRVLEGIRLVSYRVYEVNREKIAAKATNFSCVDCSTHSMIDHVIY